MKVTSLTTPLRSKDIRRLRAGDIVIISGKIVTARDKAYARVIAGKRLPINLKGGLVYHCGPIARKTPTGWKIISAGPTTSARMDPMQVEFVKRTGVRAFVGKGGVGEEVAKRLSKMGCVYLAFTGGAGVLAANQVERVEGVFWEDLGHAEAMWLLRVDNFGPLVVAIDTIGGNLYHRKKRSSIH